ncbi:LysR family transcriptional regulator [Ochrobactrum teleogrylli]|uniref:LysR family transcriptional regulator n=1 Tax=Ochrobactrum teleogrylli TaxID=2479765 RepID=A0ABY2XY88_9HYPH|nr:LysR family transcriptional regulator [[Ochrobactrum] teleogrylli]TNV09343.1 LysR family transcriptional regulator [[Ochrobactrum] teleogrylli]
MNIRQLKLFSAIYETQSVSLAAERLFISQPAASKMLATLEDHVGYQLFRREGGRLRPTPEAHLLSDEIIEVLHGFDRLNLSFRHAGRGMRGGVRLAAVPGPSLGFLPIIVQQFQQHWPETNCTLKTRNAVSVREMIETGQADIGITDTGIASPKYDTMSIELECYCAVNRSHPAVSAAMLSPSLLGESNWITFGPEHETFHPLLSAYREEKLAFKSNLTVDSSVQVLLMVELNAGVGLVDPLSASLVQSGQHVRFPDVLLKPFAPRITESYDIISVNSRPMSQAASSFLSYIHDALAARPIGS